MPECSSKEAVIFKQLSFLLAILTLYRIARALIESPCRSVGEDPQVPDMQTMRYSKTVAKQDRTRISARRMLPLVLEKRGSSATRLSYALWLEAVR